MTGRGPVCPTCGGPFGACSCVGKAGGVVASGGRVPVVVTAGEMLIELPAPGEDSGCAVVALELAMRAARAVVALGVALTLLGVVTLLV